MLRCYYLEEIENLSMLKSSSSIEFFKEIRSIDYKTTKIWVTLFDNSIAPKKLYFLHAKQKLKLKFLTNTTDRAFIVFCVHLR